MLHKQCDLQFVPFIMTLSTGTVTGYPDGCILSVWESFHAHEHYKTDVLYE